MMPPAGGAATSSLDLARHRILVVEDEPLIALYQESILRDAGAAVVGPAHSVPEALRLIRRSASDGEITAAVLDINLAGTTARPVAASLSAIGVPFLVVTGYDLDGFGTCPALPRLMKPFEPAALISSIRALVDEVHRCIAPPALTRASGNHVPAGLTATVAGSADQPSGPASGARAPVPVAPTHSPKDAIS